MSRIEIANPRPGSNRHTTEGQADRYVRRGEAVLIGQTLHFLEPEEQRHMQSIEQQMRSERHASDVYVTGQIWWNGAAGGSKMNPPGVVRS